MGTEPTDFNLDILFFNGEDWETFLAHETEKYRPQLTAYREMTARVQGLTAPEDIRVGIYFTAAQRMVEI